MVDSVTSWVNLVALVAPGRGGLPALPRSQQVGHRFHPASASRRKISLLTTAPSKRLWCAGAFSSRHRRQARPDEHGAHLPLLPVCACTPHPSATEPDKNRGLRWSWGGADMGLWSGAVQLQENSQSEADGRRQQCGLTPGAQMNGPRVVSGGRWAGVRSCRMQGKARRL